MTDNDGKKSRSKVSPETLKAIAAIITAIGGLGGLIIALQSAGIISPLNLHATPTPTPTPTPIPTSMPTPSEVTLIPPISTSVSTPTPTLRPQQCYSDNEPAITNHGIKLINISATCEPNPPRINSRITIEFTLQNVGNEPITFEFTFIAARNPSGENKDPGYGENTGRTIQPQEIIRTKGSIIVDSKGIWKFGPAYSLKLPDGTTEGNPNEWRRFPISVE